jgi:hypothetical protein
MRYYETRLKLNSRAANGNHSYHYYIQSIDSAAIPHFFFVRSQTLKDRSRRHTVLWRDTAGNCKRSAKPSAPISLLYRPGPSNIVAIGPFRANAVLSGHAAPPWL